MHTHRTKWKGIRADCRFYILGGHRDRGGKFLHVCHKPLELWTAGILSPMDGLAGWGTSCGWSNLFVSAFCIQFCSFIKIYIVRRAEDGEWGESEVCMQKKNWIFEFRWNMGCSNADERWRQENWSRDESFHVHRCLNPFVFFIFRLELLPSQLFCSMCRTITKKLDATERTWRIEAWQVWILVSKQPSFFSNKVMN